VVRGSSFIFSFKKATRAIFVKNLLLKTVLFFALCTVAILLPRFIGAVRLRTMSFEIPRDKTIVFIGDSHVELGCNPALIPNSFNFAKSGDPYLDQFCRLRRLLDDNSQISLVFISATPHSISRYGDERVFANFALKEVVAKALPIYGNEELTVYFPAETKRLAKFTLCDPIESWKSVFRSRERALAQLGEFVESSGKNLEKSVAVERGLVRGKKLHGNDACGNALQLRYLRKIVDLTREHGAEIIFLNPPLYRAREFFDVDFFEKMLRENFPDVEFWDYGDFPVSDDCRQDINHLNRWGAEIFSKELAARIQKLRFTGTAAARGGKGESECSREKSERGRLWNRRKF